MTVDMFSAVITTGLITSITEPELLNNTYFVVNISLFEEHVAYMITKPDYMSSMNYAKFYPVNFLYQYKANNCNWVVVEANNPVELEKFEIESLAISNEAGAGNLRIYLEGMR